MKYENQIICGDSLEIMRGMEDKSVDLVVTDIPYNISQKHGGLREIDYGDWDKDISIETVLEWTREMIRVSKNGVYIFCGNEQFSYIFEECKKADLITKTYYWLKPNPSVMNGQHFWLSSGELAVMAKTRNSIFNGNCEKAYQIKKDNVESRNHPNQKPIEIISDFIKKSSNEGDIILDPFLGGGTTALATKQLNRRYIGIELQEKYVSIAEARLRQDILL